MPTWVGHSAAGLPAAIRWFPAVGALIGSLAALVYLLAAQVWPAQVALLLSMASSIYLTGAFRRRWPVRHRRWSGWWLALNVSWAIMKDSRLGNYGAIALWLALSGKFALLAAQPAVLLPAILLAGHTLSACAASLLAALDYAREDAHSKAKPLATRLAPGPLVFALACGLLPLALLPWPQALSGLLLAALASFWLARKFQRWLGGYTGDCPRHPTDRGTCLLSRRTGAVATMSASHTLYLIRHPRPLIAPGSAIAGSTLPPKTPCRLPPPCAPCCQPAPRSGAARCSVAAFWPGICTRSPEWTNACRKSISATGKDGPGTTFPARKSCLGRRPPPLHTPPGGESPARLSARVNAFLAELPPGAHIIVTHAGIIRALYSRASGQPLEKVFAATGSGLRQPDPDGAAPGD